jgi:hypothetical protein
MGIRTYRYLPHQALARVNARHPWSHNDYFHGWILRSLPVGRDLAVDIDCARACSPGSWPRASGTSAELMRTKAWPPATTTPRSLWLL